MLDLAAIRPAGARRFPGPRAAASRCSWASAPTWRRSSDLSVADDGTARAEKVVCAVGWGIVVNPDTVVAQSEGGIVYGLTAALYGDMTIAKGRVVQSNFDDYPALRIDEMPAVEVHIVNSGEAPGGLCEPGTSAIAPAVTNAIFAAIGKRLRKLPVNPELLKRA